MNIFNYNVKEFWKYLASRILIFGVFVYFTFPLFWMFWTSIKPRKFAYVPGKIFFKPTIQGYIEALNSYRLPQLALNSLIVSLVASFTALVIGTLAAYALARFEYRYRKANMLFILMVRFIPPIALVLPMYLLANFTGLLDTRLILIAAYQILCITFTILIVIDWKINPI